MQALIYGVLTAVVGVIMLTGTLMTTYRNASGEYTKANATTTLTTSESNLFGVTGIVIIAAVIMVILKLLS